MVDLSRSEHPRSDVDRVMRGARHIPGPRGLPLFKPPYGASSPSTSQGGILWTAANGDGPRDHPAIAHLDLPPLGQGGRAAPLVTQPEGTRSASGPRLGQGGRAAPLVTRSLVFLGEGANVGAAFLPPGSGGRAFRAFDKRTGEVAWGTELPGGTTAAPISYRVDGRQYIVATVGWSDMTSEYVALALPETAER